MLQSLHWYRYWQQNSSHCALTLLHPVSRTLPGGIFYRKKTGNPCSLTMLRRHRLVASVNLMTLHRLWPFSLPIRSVPDAREIADALQLRGVKLALGTSLYDPADPMGKMFFNVLATFAEFEGDLIQLRTREGIPIARAKGKLRGKQPKLSDKQQKELCRMHKTGEYSISDLAELFSVSRPTIYRTLARIGSRID